MAKLTPTAVEEIFADCMFRNEEVIDGAAPEGAVIVEGVIATVGFHPVRIKAHEQEIIDLLKELPDTFFRSGGGGWSFLNMCTDKNDNLWTGFHRVMEELYLLGAAIGKAEFCLPREFWSVLPGGMPYIIINL